MTFRNGSWRARLTVLGVFALGVALGALAMEFYQQSVRGRSSAGPPPRGESARERHLQYLVKELGLTQEQTERVRRILDETRQEFLQLRNEMRPRFEEIRRRSRERLRAVLTPEQQAKFDELMRRMDEERERHRRDEPKGK
ncbi:hypothetical protein HRbin10_00419 [bacterium HR10]|nr:hypothetical protein HRbin10_00419 [bacterium HR10]